MIWTQCHPQANEHQLGFIPSFFSEDFDGSAQSQVEANYCGGWNPQGGFTLGGNADLTKPSTLALYFPCDPPMHPMWCAVLGKQLIVVYEYGYTAIFDPDLGFEASRLD